MNFSIISAFTKNYVIGKLNSIPWVIPRDMAWFKYHTLNKILIMGRKTFTSIGSKPLSNRLNVVLSRKNLIENRRSVPNLFFVKTFEEAVWVVRREMHNNSSEIMVIGGGEVYNMFFSQVRRLYLTRIGMTVQGDTFFPNYEENEWKMIFNENANFSYGDCSCSFEIFERF